MGRWLCWKCACCRFENLGSNPQNPCKKPDVVANTCDPGNGEEGRGDEEIALCLLPKLLWSTWWGSRPVSNTVANRRCKVPEECNLRLFSNLHMYTQAHLCTDTHTQNMHIHMHANAQTHQFQNEIWVKIVKKKNQILWNLKCYSVKITPFAPIKRRRGSVQLTQVSVGLTSHAMFKGIAHNCKAFPVWCAAAL